MKANLNCNGNRKRRTVWRKPIIKRLKKNVCHSVKHGGGSIMIWGCFSYAGLGNLIPIEGIIRADDYIQIVNENLEESAERMGLRITFYFQQNNDPKHTTKKNCEVF